MKIKSITIKNVKSFKDEIKINFDEFNILIGPNGGGKSNLFDIITVTLRNFLLLGYKIDHLSHMSSTSIIKQIYQDSPFENIDKELDKFIGEESESSIKIELQIGKQDIENINLWKFNRLKFESLLKSYKTNYIRDLLFFKKLEIENIQENQNLNFIITNNELVEPSANSPEYTYLQYLNYFELFFGLSKEIKDVKLSPICLYFSPYRGEKEDKLQANLSSDDIYELLRNYFGSTSKNTTSLIKIASLYFADKRRNYEAKANVEGYEKLWDDDKEVKIVTKYLAKLGYSWDLELKDNNKNIYEILLIKDDRNFSIGQASSGEKEIINFLLGIIAFNIKDSLIIVDEPELHLHPKWQSMLVDLFTDLSKVTGNQFILSTHSAVFINERTISNIIRIYREENTSNAIPITKDNLDNTKDLLHIINSYNNEKMFFADKVVLVEGIMDRLVFEKILEIYSSLFVETPEIIEVLEVGGKSNLEKYRDFLNSIKVKNYTIADYDYILQKGDEGIKNLFIPDHKKSGEVLKDKKSEDAKSVSKQLDQAIQTKNLEELKKVWDYIKNRKLKIKENLTPEEQFKLTLFFSQNFQDRIYILQKGEIEDYLPNEFKKLDKVINLVKKRDFLLQIEADKLEEINKIAFEILEIPNPGKEEITKRLNDEEPKK